MKHNKTSDARRKIQDESPCVKTIIVMSAAFFMLFITLLRKPDSTGSGFLASFSLTKGRPIRSSQAGQSDSRHDSLLNKAGGTIPVAVHRPAIISTPLPIQAGSSASSFDTAQDRQGGPAVLSRTHLGEGGPEISLDGPPALYDWLDELIDRIQIVESGTRGRGPGVREIPDGDDGEAVGILQIHRCVITDVNRFYGTRFTDEDRRNPVKSKLIARLYISHWMNVHRVEIASKIWVGGPDGWRQKCTEDYWQKIKKVR